MRQSAFFKELKDMYGKKLLQSKAFLEYGGCARSTNGSQTLAVLRKRHDNSDFSWQLTKIKTMRNFL